VSRAEFDPTSEKHRVALLIKWVDPGCTTELQIEHPDGTVLRLTSTESSANDRVEFMNAVVHAFTCEMNRQGI
jgi:predicted RNase H-like nuclease (RuvC/YqgF family)